MKRNKNLYIFLIISILCTSILQTQASNAEAENAYNRKQYDKAAELFEQQVAHHKQQGKQAAMLYYNLGNAYYRSGKIANAVLNYERALRLDPSNNLIRNNIAFANTRIEDKQMQKPQLIFTWWINAISNMLTANGWATWAIVTFLLLLASVGLFLFAKQIRMRQIFFYSGIALLCFCVVFNVFAYWQKQQSIANNQAIVMSPTLTVRTTPDESSSEIVMLHAGSKLVILQTQGNWYRIEAPNGDKGWVNKNKVEII